MEVWLEQMGSKLIEWVLINIHPKTTIGHHWIWVGHVRIHPLVGIHNHHVGILSIPSHLKLVVIRHKIANLL